MGNISFTIKSVEPCGICPSDLCKVIQDCHLDAKYLQAQVDEASLSDGDLCFRDIALDNADPIIKKLCSKIYNPLVRVSIPQISMDIDIPWNLTQDEVELLMKRGYEIDICKL